MNIDQFCRKMERAFSPDAMNRPTFLYGNRLTRFFFDPCPGVEGMASIKKLRLLNLAFGCLAPDEAYLEVGTYVGKSLIFALRNNPLRTAYACDNFSEFTSSNSFSRLKHNLEAQRLWDRVTFLDGDFASVLDKETIPVPVGVYFYDGAHDLKSQFNGIQVAEPLLADEALVIVDDWRFAADSQSYAKQGTEDALRQSPNEWTRLYELPARYNGDRYMWWNGVAVFAFRRRAL